MLARTRSARLELVSLLETEVVTCDVDAAEIAAPRIWLAVTVAGGSVTVVVVEAKASCLEGWPKIDPLTNEFV